MSTVSVLDKQPGNREEIEYSQYTNGVWQRISSTLPDEMLFSIFVNQQELVSILCTPEKLNCLVVGYLRAEGFINSLGDIAMMRVCIDESLADVQLKHQLNVLPSKRVLTSGCGRGVSFDSMPNLQPVSSNWRVSPSQILSSFALLQKSEKEGENEKMRNGMHVSALSDGRELVVRAEDIGRHNTLDKIWGECMLRKISPENLLLISTGRISSEMLIKAARMKIPVVASLNSATSRAVNLGAELGIAVVGYVRGTRLAAYCCEHRLLPNGLDH